MEDAPERAAAPPVPSFSDGSPLPRHPKPIITRGTCRIVERRMVTSVSWRRPTSSTYVAYQADIRERREIRAAPRGARTPRPRRTALAAVRGPSRSFASGRTLGLGRSFPDAELSRRTSGLPFPSAPAKTSLAPSRLPRAGEQGTVRGEPTPRSVDRRRMQENACVCRASIARSSQRRSMCGGGTTRAIRLLVARTKGAAR